VGRERLEEARGFGFPFWVIAHQADATGAGKFGDRKQGIAAKDYADDVAALSRGLSINRSGA